MKIYEEKGFLPTAKNVEIEKREYFSDSNAPQVVFAKGIGGCAGNGLLVDALAKDHRVVTFSPRNSGESNGQFTLDNYLYDLSYILDDSAQHRGELPRGIGHSTGGYALGRMLGEKKVVERAVLLAPLLKITEQLPEFLNRYLESCAKKGKVPLRALAWIYNGRVSNDIALDQQRFDFDEFPNFLRSLYGAPKCENKLKAPTKVLLAGGACTRLPLRDLEKYEDGWKNLGADVELSPEMDHWFSSQRKFLGFGKPFKAGLKKGMANNIMDFLGRSQ